MTPELESQLALLRDIRVPEDIGWWPLAPGWWFAIALFCAAILGAVLWTFLRQRTARYAALRELEKLEASDPIDFATNLSVLLRRVARRKDEYATQLSGESWAKYLSDTGLTPALAQHVAEATYAARTDTAPAAETLRSAAATWIRRQA